MKKITSVIFIALLLSQCSPIPQFELPYTGMPPLVTYSKVVETSADKGINYDNVMKKFMEIVLDAKIKNDDKTNSYFQIVGHTVYKYKGHDRKCSYILSFQAEDNECRLTINQLKIMHYNIERMYFDEKRKTIKKFNPSYEDINTKLNAIMDELVKQLK